MTNLVVASVDVVVSVDNVVGEAWTYDYGRAVTLEVAVLAVILRLAWTWPRARLPVVNDRQVDHRPRGVRPDGHGGACAGGPTLTRPTRGERDRRRCPRVGR